MGQLTFFDAEKRLAALSEKGDLLEAIAALVPWEIRRYAVTDAAVHDSRKLNGLLQRDNTSQDAFADSAYRSAAIEASSKGRGLRSRIHVRAARGHPLSKAKAAANRTKSRIRARIEHVFGAQETA